MEVINNHPLMRKLNDLDRFVVRKASPGAIQIDFGWKHNQKRVSEPWGIVRHGATGDVGHGATGDLRHGAAGHLRHGATE